MIKKIFALILFSCIIILTSCNKQYQSNGQIENSIEESSNSNSRYNIWAKDGSYFGYVFNNKLYDKNDSFIGNINNNYVYDNSGQYIGKINSGDRFITDSIFPEIKPIQPIQPIEPIAPIKPIKPVEPIPQFPQFPN